MNSRDELLRRIDELSESIESAKRLSKNLMSIAKKDLEAAKVLYDRKLYPQAVFMIEQCCEKALKSFLVEKWVSEIPKGMNTEDLSRALSALLRL